MSFSLADLRYPGHDLRWYDLDLPWSERDESAYLRTGRTACRIRGTAGGRKDDLAFLSTLQPLLGVELLGGPRRDGIVFELADLIRLTLDNAGASPFDPARLQNLAQLYVNVRPSVERIAECPALRVLTVKGWRSDDLSAIRYPSSLSYLRIVGRRQEFTFTGIGASASLDICRIHGMLPRSLAGIEGQPALRALHIEGSRHATARVLDLAPLRHMPALTWLHLQHCGRIGSLRPLLDLPSLAGVSLGSCDVADGDLRPLIELPPSTHVGFGDRPHYSHTLEEIRRIRGQASPRTRR